MPLVLASASPRRQELLRNAGIAFHVRAANVAEEHRSGEGPRDYVLRLASEKARAVAETAHAEEVILGADTEVVMDLASGTPLGKPRDAEDAARMLRELSGRQHYVITGVALMWDVEGQWRSEARVEVTRVFFESISEPEISAYANSPEPLDKAGAYAIQGVASRWIPRIEGCYFNVVGLPVPLVYRMLKEHASQVLG
jgi:septum formation protein